jgi:hypothetical protein
MNRENQSETSLSRRHLLFAGAAGATGMLLGAGNPVARAAIPGFNADDPASVLRAVIRMRYSEDGRLTMGWLKARRFGVVDAEITPLFGMVTGTFGRHRVLDDGSVENVSFELAFYTDLESGEVLDSITIPYTNKTVEVPRLLLGPSKSRTLPLFHRVRESGTAPPEADAASTSAMRPAGSSRVENWLGPVTMKDNDIWIAQASSATRIPADPKARKVIYNEALSNAADASDLIDSDLPSVPAKLGYTGISSWRPWMEMGDHPGHTVSSGFGGKAFHADELPDDYRAMAERFYPEALADPAAILAKA